MRPGDPPASVWTLWKNQRSLRLTVRGHPLGRELLLHIDQDLLRALVVRDQQEMLDMACAWRDIAEGRGWETVVRGFPTDS